MEGLVIRSSRSTSCKLCDSFNTKKIFNASNIHGRHVLDLEDKFEISKCNNCEVIFIINILIDPEYYSKYYPQNYYNNELSNCVINYLVNLMYKLSVKITERQILENLQLNKKTKLKILDIGCGSGRFLTSISNDRFDKYGIEINPEGYKICIGKKLKVYNQELKDINFEDNVFDIITLWHVIEHLDKPKEIMVSMQRILKKDGIIVISTPNTDSLGFKYGRNMWFHLDAPRHLILYNRKSLEYLLNRTGFKVIQEKNIFYDFPLDLFWSIRRRWMKYFIYPLYPIFKFLERESILFFAKK